MKPNFKRLRNVVTALRDAAKNEKLTRLFSMQQYGYSSHFSTLMSQLEDTADEKCMKTPALVGAYEKLRRERTIPHNCGTPSCALGHFALRGDLQRTFTLTSKGQLVLRKKKHRSLHADSEEIRDYFGLVDDDAELLFGSEGCNKATTPTEAADFIEAWIKNQEAYYG